MGPIAVVASLIFALYAVMSILLSSGNTIGQMCRYLLAGGFVFCLLQPRMGFFVWLVACAYNDLLKRLMVIGGRISWNDLPVVLGITPMMFGGILVALIMGGLMGSRRVTMSHWTMLLVGIALMMLNGALAFFTEGHQVGKTLQSVANDGLYMNLIFVVPVLFQDTEDVKKVCRYLLWIFLPVAAYGMMQQIYGYQDFELAYLRSGLSLEVKQLIENRIRAFSTLNSPTALGAVCAALAGLSLALTARDRKRGEKATLNPVLGFAMFLIFIGGLLASTARTALVAPPFILAAAWALQEKKRMVVLYTAAGISFLLLVGASPFLLDHLDSVNMAIASEVQSDSYQAGMVAVGTYSDRLYGFANVLLNPKAWTVFGYGLQEMGGYDDRFHYHDPISAILVRFGALALVFVVLSVFVILRFVHGQVCDMRNPALRRFASVMQAVSIGLGVVGLLSGSILSIFPINVVFWLAWGCVVLLISLDKEQEPAPEEALQAQPAPRPAVQRTRRPPPVKSIPISQQ